MTRIVLRVQGLFVTSALIVVIAVVLLWGSARPTVPVVAGAILWALAFAALDAAYAPRLPDIYWLDAGAELLLAALLASAWARRGAAG